MNCLWGLGTVCRGAEDGNTLSVAGEQRGGNDRTLKFKQGHEIVSRGSPDVVCLCSKVAFQA
jgi:hypothetical protein